MLGEHTRRGLRQITECQHFHMESFTGFQSSIPLFNFEIRFASLKRDGNFGVAERMENYDVRKIGFFCVCL